MKSLIMILIILSAAITASAQCRYSNQRDFPNCFAHLPCVKVNGKHLPNCTHQPGSKGVTVNPARGARAALLGLGNGYEMRFSNGTIMLFDFQGHHKAHIERHDARWYPLRVRR